MKRYWPLFVFVLLCVACGGVPTEPTSPTQPSPTSTSTPKATPTPTPIPTPTPWPTPEPKKVGAPTIGVILHPWYGANPKSCPTVGDPFVNWPFWPWGGRLDDPCKTISGVPWLREISSPVYPITGPYIGGWEELRRQQMREAKAGGVDEFWPTNNSWVPSTAYLHDLFFGTDTIKGSLQIAQEEQFHMGLEKWGLGSGDNLAYWAPLWKADFLRDYDSVMASKFKGAYVYIDGKPAFWSFYPHWMSEQEMIEFFDGTDDNPRAFVGILRACSMQEVIDLNTKLKRSRVQYQSMNSFPTETGWNTDPNAATTQHLISDLEASKQAGLIPIAHTYPGFDERAGIPNPEQPYSMRWGPRSGNQSLSNFMQTAIAHGATRILIESWDEWGEGSTIAPAYPVVQWRDFGQERDLYLDDQGNVDPYKYLKIIWSFVGDGPWTSPPPPPCSVVDPLMLKYYPNYQCRN